MSQNRSFEYFGSKEERIRINCINRTRQSTDFDNGELLCDELVQDDSIIMNSIDLLNLLIQSIVEDEIKESFDELVSIIQKYEYVAIHIAEVSSNQDFFLEIIASMKKNSLCCNLMIRLFAELAYASSYFVTCLLNNGYLHNIIDFLLEINPSIEIQGSFLFLFGTLYSDSPEAREEIKEYDAIQLIIAFKSCFKYLNTMKDAFFCCSLMISSDFFDKKGIIDYVSVFEEIEPQMSFIFENITDESSYLEYLLKFLKFFCSNKLMVNVFTSNSNVLYLVNIKDRIPLVDFDYYLDIIISIITWSEKEIVEIIYKSFGMSFIIQFSPEARVNLLSTFFVYISTLCSKLEFVVNDVFEQKIFIYFQSILNEQSGLYKMAFFNFLYSIFPFCSVDEVKSNMINPEIISLALEMWDFEGCIESESNKPYDLLKKISRVLSITNSNEPLLSEWEQSFTNLLL